MSTDTYCSWPSNGSQKKNSRHCNVLARCFVSMKSAGSFSSLISNSCVVVAALRLVFLKEATQKAIDSAKSGNGFDAIGKFLFTYLCSCMSY